MQWSFLFFFNSALLGVGLAMDAFSISLANGLNEPKMKIRRMVLVAGVFGGFQALMPMVGWICVHTIVERFRTFERMVPWIALILLGWIGGKMLFSGIRNQGGDPQPSRLTLWTLIVQGIATSIDALSVGFTMASYEFWMSLVCALVIAFVTFVICMGGVAIGKKAGTGLSNRAELVGGVILIVIGLEIFISNMIG